MFNTIRSLYHKFMYKILCYQFRTTPMISNYELSGRLWKKMSIHLELFNKYRKSK
jgi:hypothetical protein